MGSYLSTYGVKEDMSGNIIKPDIEDITNLEKAIDSLKLDKANFNSLSLIL